MNNPHSVTATVQDDDGNPITGRDVTFTIISGPHAGLTATIATGSAGKAVFTYTGTNGGLDTIIASFEDSEGQTITSNEVTKEWTLPTNLPPEAKCQDVIVSANQSCQANTSVDNGSFDPDGDPITLQQDPAGPYELGDTWVDLTVFDGELYDVCSAMITVEDNIPPSIISLITTTLWPPNHKMVKVATVSASDNCDAEPAIVISVTHNEDPHNNNGVGDGNTAPDWQIDNDGSIWLRAERNGTGTDRIYTISVSATDDSGNETTATATVTVPHNQGQGKGKK